MEKGIIKPEPQDVHTRLDQLFAEVEDLSKKDIEKARVKLTIALNIIKQEFRKLRK